MNEREKEYRPDCDHGNFAECIQCHRETVRELRLYIGKQRDEFAAALRASEQREAALKAELVQYHNALEWALEYGDFDVSNDNPMHWRSHLAALELLKKRPAPPTAETGKEDKGA